MFLLIHPYIPFAAKPQLNTQLNIAEVNITFSTIYLDAFARLLSLN